MTQGKKIIEIPEGKRPVQAVENPILSSPYEEPKMHWNYRQDGSPEKADGRRPASYWFKDKRTGTAQMELFAEEQRDDLPLINALRMDVKRWRESGYRGASPVTLDLLNWWSRNDAPRRLFFCQREAVETLIYLLELRMPGRSPRTGYKKFVCSDKDIQRMLKGESPQGFHLADPKMAPSLVDPSANESLLPLIRLGCKMATGSGKTVVMAMLIAWAFCNRDRNPATTSYPNGVLICAPNLTVRKRLQVLKPESVDNYYDEFEIVPAKYRSALSKGKVHITNWHFFSPKSPHSDGGKTSKVIDKGEEGLDAFSINRLGDLASRLPILVLNDEGHHCWRPNVNTEKAVKEEQKGKSAEEKRNLKEEVEEARLWLEGLDKINNGGLLEPGEPGILAAVDMSATPFYLSGSGHPEGRPFPWLVSDFGLVDAIESGIVKIPRMPVLQEGGENTTDDAGRPDPKYFRLWKHIQDQIPAAEKIRGKPKPEAVYMQAESALVTLAGQWKERFDGDAAANPTQEHVPPVLIVVCDNTEISKVFYEKISGEKEVLVPVEGKKKPAVEVVYEQSAVLSEFANEDGARKRTIRIDSKMLKEMETEGGESRDQASQRIREIIDTVGKPGQPGEHVRCVVSVSMLTEGWDANNVTHVLGVRAFGSQLLCEQVVGRGLRRRRYDADENGMFQPEYVDVYGIPFSLIPFKGKSQDSSADEDRPRNHIHAEFEREQFEMKLPQVESYVYEHKGCGVTCDVDQLEGFHVSDEPVKVYLDATRGYNDKDSSHVYTLDKSSFIEQDREAYYKGIHMQAILFRIVQMVIEELVQGVGVNEEKQVLMPLQAKHLMFPGVLNIVREYVDTKVTFAADVNRKELGLEKYARRVVERIRDGVQADSHSGGRLLPVINSHKPYLSTSEVDYTTVRPVVPVEKSHLNAVAIDAESTERPAVEILDAHPLVECFTPNDRNVGLQIPYDYGDARHNYEPDFIIRLRGGVHFILETKGGGGNRQPDRVFAKNAAAKRWVEAVNNLRTFGQWAFEICHEDGHGNLPGLEGQLQKHADCEEGKEIFPFRLVDPEESERWVACIPVTTLKAAAGAFSEEQIQTGLFPSDLAESWAEVDSPHSFKEGMFLAQVRGRSMEPKIGDGDWCLFGPPSAGSREGKIVLVAQLGVSDPAYGGQYTVKRYRSEKVVSEDGSWEHSVIHLEPLNDDFEPIRLTQEDEGAVRIVAEFVEVVGG
jgi:type III restriction enzyme